MSADPNRRPSTRACTDCLRRSWLLSELGGPLEFLARDRTRLIEALELEDGQLLDAVAGRRRQELRSRHLAFRVQHPDHRAGAAAICRHDIGYPRSLIDDGAPRMLNVLGGHIRLQALTAAPTVAIVGTTRCSDYGLEVARALARGLAASGVTVIAPLREGIALAAHEGAFEARSATLTLTPGGLSRAPARMRPLLARVLERGCAVSELPDDYRARRWSELAGQRVIAGLAALTIVVEADDSPGELAIATLAARLGRTVAAVPGRLTSPVALGPHALLFAGAKLVRGADDALELLYPMGADRSSESARRKDHRLLEPRLRGLLERVARGEDTPDALAGPGDDPAAVLAALSELELLGLIGRGDGGRYLARASPDRR